jgi:hypothetical protein
VSLVISKSRLWPKVGYVPNRGQRQIHQATERFLVTAAGRRFGKSTSGGMELLPEVYKTYLQKDHLHEIGRRREFWIVGPQYTDSEKEFRAFYNACKRLKMPFDKPGTYYDPHGGDMQASLWGGRFLVLGQSAKYPEHLVGEGLHGVLMAEAAKMKLMIWDKYVRPTLADFRGWAKFNSTPEGRNWFYDLWQMGQHGLNPEFRSFRFPSWANEKIFPMGVDDPEIISLCAGLSEEMVKQEIHADFSEYVGQVFKDWDEEWHVQPCDYNPEWPVYLAVDYGWTNPNVCLFIQVDPWDRVYVIDEYYQSHRSPEEFAIDLLEGNYSQTHPRLVRAAADLYPDPATPGSSHTLAERLRVRVRGNTGGEIKDRLELIRRWLKDENTHLERSHVDRRPKMIVSPRCKYMIKEFDAYRYPKTKEEGAEAPENPMKKDDHTPEALGRFFMGHFGMQAIGGQPRVKKVQVTRGRRAVARRRTTR